MQHRLIKPTHSINFIVYSRADSGTEIHTERFDGFNYDSESDREMISRIIYGTGDGYEGEEPDWVGVVPGLNASIYAVDARFLGIVNDCLIGNIEPDEIPDGLEGEVIKACLIAKRAHSSHAFSALERLGVAEELCLGDFI